MTETQGGRTEAVMSAVRRKLAGRALMPGERLPSIRGLAASMAVSPSTVAEAYDRLVADGVIRSRPGSGFYATDGLAPLALADIGPRLDRAIDPLWVSRQSLDATSDRAKPGCGWLPADWMPTGAIRRAMRGLARTGTDDALVDYGSTRGSSALRRLLLRRLAEQAIEATPDHLLLTGSGTQAIDLICRFLLQPGDTVLVDDPCYFNFQALLRAHQAKVVGVPYTPSGPNTAAFETALIEHRPRLYLTNAALHNPTGATMAPAVAHRLLTLAATHDLIVVEDDIFGDLEPEPSPRLAALDGLSRVIWLTSFSKTLSASVRCGCIAARPDWIEGLADLQIATCFGGPSPIATEVIAGVLGDGSYRKHLGSLRTRLGRARHDVEARLAPLGIRPWHHPRGGFYLWCRLPDGRDAATLARAALREDVVLAPGNVFSVEQTVPDFMRFNVAQCSDPDLTSVLERALAEASRRKPDTP